MMGSPPLWTPIDRAKEERDLSDYPDTFDLYTIASLRVRVAGVVLLYRKGTSVSVEAKVLGWWVAVKSNRQVKVDDVMSA